jgi:hypothetical protein
MKWPERLSTTNGTAFFETHGPSTFAERRKSRPNMYWKILHQRAYLNLIGAVILLIGIGSAAVIYQRAGNIPYGAWGYETVNGTFYPIRPEDSKMYRHNLEVMGGKLSVMMDDFSNWFGGLWHGKSLAVIIGSITIMISFGFFYQARHLTCGPEKKRAKGKLPNQL